MMKYEPTQEKLIADLCCNEGNDLKDRTFNFAVKTIKFLKTLEYSKESEVIRYQVAKSATSVGANYEEAQGSFSKNDFKYKISICLKEGRESNYWFRIIEQSDIQCSREQLTWLIKESEELKAILISINKKNKLSKITF